MTLTDLWVELKALPHTIGEPFRDRTWFRQHTAAHLVGGPLWWAVGYLGLHWTALLLGRHLWSPGWALAFAATGTVIRQGWMRETKGPGEFPLYAMVWDSATSIGAAAVTAWVCG